MLSIDMHGIGQRVLAVNADGESIDPHATLAAQVLGKDVNAVTEHERGLAKAVNYYYWYGANHEL